MRGKKCLLKNLVAWGVVPALLLGLAASVPVQAGDLYAGVGFGNAKMTENNICGVAGSLLSGGYSCSSSDNTNNAFKLVGGYQLMDVLGFELSYLNFGGTSANAKSTSTSVTAATTFDVDGFAFAGVGTLPITKDFGLIGRVGMFRWKVQSEASIPGGRSTLARDTKPGFAFNNIGVGFKYGISKTMDMRVEWERFKDVGNTLITGSSDINLITLGLLYKFQ
ncbi:outer membrane beta-barrel protein [Sulfuricaulis sp.]|jgi:hypothetical protein|uniref:outer membrane beta-barrel protein n=1 Tax=Sulfuricaulis sp. TaxID=2003553 RepID=UPI00355A008D